MTNDHTIVTHKKRDVSVCHKTQNLSIRCRHMLTSHDCRHMSTSVGSNQTTFLQYIRRVIKRQRYARQSDIVFWPLCDAVSVVALTHSFEDKIDFYHN